ncbi:hypothetical protein [Bacillus sp. EB600]|uniref:hypothetical protein n=1 Tax=Bacillus sp. EB600 TaxID=2806345 RepID=UPI00210D0131|nr:hypothetical protein [Bacillus sp. EB600]MCQ6280393.1 hypothetical protein [Bacillus sp. EB600]
MFFIPAKVNIGGIKINSPDHLSSVSFGQNFIIGENVAGKKNQGFGQQMADFTMVAVPIQITLDNDLIDIPSIKINK